MDLATESATTSAAEVNDEQPFELSQDGEIMVPERLLSDWVVMILLSIIILVGVPLNILTLIRLMNSLNKGKGSVKIKQEATRTAFIWMKIHLTIVDLIVILLYCPAHAGWLFTYTWLGGEFLCAAIQFAWDFSFHLLIGLRTVYMLMHNSQNARSSVKQLKFVKKLIVFCYVGAALFSIPQWFVWTTIDMRTWTQCTTIWHVKRAIQYINNQAITDSYEDERIYTMFHLLTVFWLPFIVLFIAYLYIVVFLFCYSIRPYAISNDANLLRNEAADSNENLQLWPNQCSGTPPLTFGVNGSIRSGLTNGSVPAWRLEMRSKMFRTTVYVISVYLICWLPYNVLSLATFLSSELQIVVTFHLELLRVFVLFNTILNPIIYCAQD
ncbi:Gonadotropin-releasing hormone receptor [Aphelenchoides bicaudatus]|nr:Gonadotropin-releasing hormone receptor [Aphelenchoides bicaudatus]